ncbi:MAG: replication initiator protein [Microvirus sp.]|nr:MAG: replication initiator protein [Microvirus sp.]
MPCYRPLDAFQCVDGAVVFTEGKGNKRHDISRSLLLACGQCVGCRLERSRQWATRCIHEKQFHEEACFLTISYDDKNLPEHRSLRHEDIQLFLKRLRQHVVRNLPQSKTKPTKCTPPLQWGATENQGNKFPFKRRKTKLAINYVRYYMCGEYGDQTRRPHYHMCVYGWRPKDEKFWSTSRSSIQSRIYTSATLDKIWRLGKIWIGDVTFESAAYVARYIMKKVLGQAAANHYTEIDASTGEIKQRNPEYTRMSLKPGIGARWLEKYATDVYPEGKVVVRGHTSTSPKYYDKKFKKMSPLEYEDLLFERHKEQQKRPGENSKERLATKEIVAKAKIAFLKRNAH